jgi:hypothetical protein
MGSTYAAENERDAGIKQLQSLGPLVCAFGVVFFRHLLDLPWAPAFVAQCPVFDLLRISTLKQVTAYFRSIFSLLSCDWHWCFIEGTDKP